LAHFLAHVCHKWHSLYVIKLFNSSYLEGNFRGTQLLDSSIGLSPLYPSMTNNLHVSIAMSLHQNFPWLHLYVIKLFNSSYPGGNFRGNHLLDGSISLPPPYPSMTNNLHASIAMNILHGFPWLHASQTYFTIFRTTLWLLVSHGLWLMQPNLQ
jgi:hypothetical protein